MEKKLVFVNTPKIRERKPKQVLPQSVVKQVHLNYKGNYMTHNEIPIFIGELNGL